MVAGCEASAEASAADESGDGVASTRRMAGIGILVLGGRSGAGAVYTSNEGDVERDGTARDSSGSVLLFRIFVRRRLSRVYVISCFLFDEYS